MQFYFEQLLAKLAQGTEEISCALPFIEVWIRFAYISLQFGLGKTQISFCSTSVLCYCDIFPGHLFSQHNLRSHYSPQDHYLKSK